MAETRRGLGRGLSALLGEAEEAVVTGQPSAPGSPDPLGLLDIPIELIHPHPDQPRQLFDDEEIAELAASIRERGVLQPILLRPYWNKFGHYQIVAGERRWRAAQAAGLRTIPALLKMLNDEQALEIAIIENVQRAGLNAMEEARAYRSLMDRFGYTQDQAAAAVSKSRSHVANTLRLMQLPEAVQQHLLQGRLTAGHARAILTAADPAALAEVIVEKGLSVREAEDLARAGRSAPKKASGPRKPPKDADTHALEADLEEVLGLKVDIAYRGDRGSLTIHYTTLEQLDDLCRRLTRGS